VSYRPEIKVVDVTIRDGGLMNDHRFTDDVVKAVYGACVEGGIDYMEIGYKTSKEVASPGRVRAVEVLQRGRRPAYRRRQRHEPQARRHGRRRRCDYRDDIAPKQHSVIDMIRVATYIHQIPTALDMVKDAHDKGTRRR